MTVQPTGPCPARIMLVGEYPSMKDEQLGHAFAGWTGEELDKMLKEAGIMRGSCFTTLAIRTRPPGNDIETFIAARKKDITPQHAALRDKMVMPVVWESLALLKREIAMCQPNVIITLGNVPTWLLTGNWAITKWRGSMLECDLDLGLDYKPKVLPTYNPAMVLKQWTWRQTAVEDFRRAAQMARTRENVARITSS